MKAISLLKITAFLFFLIPICLFADLADDLEQNGIGIDLKHESDFNVSGLEISSQPQLLSETMTFVTDSNKESNLNPAPSHQDALKENTSSSHEVRYTDELGGIYVLTEARAGYFYPTNNRFRKIYSGGGIYGIEVSCQTWKGFYPWVSGSYFSQSGHSIGGHTRTIITIVPIEYGLKYIYSCNRYVDVYTGLGGTATYLNMKDESPYVIRSISRWGAGGIVKFGFLIHVTNGFFFDVFSDYSFIKINFKNTHNGTLVRQNVDLSGFSFGGGFGYRF